MGHPKEFAYPPDREFMAARVLNSRDVGGTAQDDIRNAGPVGQRLGIVSEYERLDAMVRLSVKRSQAPERTTIAVTEAPPHVRRGTPLDVMGARMRDVKGVRHRGGPFGDDDRRVDHEQELADGPLVYPRDQIA